MANRPGSLRAGPSRGYLYHLLRHRENRQPKAQAFNELWNRHDMSLEAALWQGLLTLPLARPKVSLKRPDADCSWRPAVGASGTVGRPCHNRVIRTIRGFS